MSALDILINTNILSLDTFLPKTSQYDDVLEVLFWAIAYSIYAVVFQSILRSIFSKMKFWNGGIKLRSGVFCANAQDDVVLLLVCACHHMTAGILCAYGAKYNDAEIWRHGYLLEVGFELADVLAMIFHIYPHRYDNVKPEVKAGFVFHHLNGILFSGMIMTAGLHHNEHIREIAFWLLVGAAFSCFGACFTNMLNLDTQMAQATIATYLNTAFFIYCRFYIFPTEAYLVLQDVRADPSLAGSWAEKGLYVAGILLALFNVGIMSDIIPKCIRYAKRTFDGVTPLDTDDVPLSKEDRMALSQLDTRDAPLSTEDRLMQRQSRESSDTRNRTRTLDGPTTPGRRRSSFLQAVDFVDEATKRRRSSFSTMAGLNSIEDIHKAEIESKKRLQTMQKDISKME